jgi:hypothetical protein
MLLRLQGRQEAKADAAANRKAHYGGDDIGDYVEDNFLCTGGADDLLLQQLQPNFSLSCDRTRLYVDGYGIGNRWGCGCGDRDGRLVETRLSSLEQSNLLL